MDRVSEVTLSISLRGITISYGKTKLKELLKAGYTVSEEPWDSDADPDGTVTALYLFYKAGERVGVLAFYGLMKAPPASKLIESAIDLVLVEDDSILDTNPIRGFFHRIHFPLTRRNLGFFAGGYLLGCVLIIVNIVQGNMHDPVLRSLTYFFFALPFIIIGSGALFLGLRTGFGVLLRKLRFPTFVSVCFLLWMGATYISVFLAVSLRTGDQGFLIPLIPLFILLGLSGWACIHIVMYLGYERFTGVRYLLVHIPLILVLVVLPVVEAKIPQMNRGAGLPALDSLSVASLFGVVIYLQLCIYALFAMVGLPHKLTTWALRKRKLQG